jgi:hypothetical protein
VKLWIIYKEGLGFSKLIAENLQDRFEDYIDVLVGNAEKIDPAFLVEEKLDYLIIGDNSSESIPSLEIQNWLSKFGELLKKNNFIIKVISIFYVTSADVLVEPPWIELLQDNVSTELVYPPILCLKFNTVGLVLEDGAFDKVKDYANDFIEFLIKSEII